MWVTNILLLSLFCRVSLTSFSSHYLLTSFYFIGKGSSERRKPRKKAALRREELHCSRCKQRSDGKLCHLMSFQIPKHFQVSTADFCVCLQYYLANGQIHQSKGTRQAALWRQQTGERWCFQIFPTPAQLATLMLICAYHIRSEETKHTDRHGWSAARWGQAGLQQHPVQ